MQILTEIAMRMGRVQGNGYGLLDRFTSTDFCADILAHSGAARA